MGDFIPDESKVAIVTGATVGSTLPSCYFLLLIVHRFRVASGLGWLPICIIEDTESQSADDAKKRVKMLFRPSINPANLLSSCNAM
jgi:heme/copper-type cytochrome/quinol oxidase subunit 3